MMIIRQVLLIIFLSLSFILINCSDTCEVENPRVQLFNNGTDKADIQIKTSGGNTENINNIEPGSYSDKRSFDPGEIEFTINIQGEENPIVYYLIVNLCTENLVLINADNTVSAKSIKLDYF
jgi:hypothetical protein